VRYNVIYVALYPAVMMAIPERRRAEVRPLVSGARASTGSRAARGPSSPAAERNGKVGADVGWPLARVGRGGASEK
jgi:hypothetical protein